MHESIAMIVTLLQQLHEVPSAISSPQTLPCTVIVLGEEGYDQRLA